MAKILKRVPRTRAEGAAIHSASGDVTPFVSNNLPIQATSFIGREMEIAEIRSLLSRARIVTLTGAGGCGKSRLALQVAAESLKAYPDGVWFAPLSSLIDAALVARAVAEALSIKEDPREPAIDTIVRRLRRRALLLLLDNCEHLRDACAGVAEALARACPALGVLATSREPLHCEGEVVYAVPPLPVPTTPLVLASVKQADAVRLFTERSVAITPTFQVTDGNAEVVAGICRRLDGIPLAIEMAAARMKVLSENDIFRRLDDRFSLLTTGDKRLPQHQTLRAVLDWSHALLSRQEQTLLSRVAVFAGGWTLEAAESVCADDTIGAHQVLDLLAELVDKSMVIADKRQEGVRFRLLESMREYALERLARTDEATGQRRRHLAWYVRFAEEANVRVRGFDQERWWGQLEVEHDNIRSALQWAILDPDGAEAGMRLAAAMSVFWSIGDNLREGFGWFERLLSRPGGVSHATRVRALGGAAFLARAMGRFEQSAGFAGQALQLARQGNDQLSLATAQLWAGISALDSRNLGGADALLTESLRHLTESQDHWRAVACISALADVAQTRGDLQGATTHLERCLALSRDIGDIRRTAIIFRRLGSITIQKRDASAAATLFAESLRIARRFKARRTVAADLAGLAAVAALRGQFRQTASLFGAAAAQREPVDASIAADDRAEEERIATLARRAIGKRAFAAAFAEGQAMTFDQAIEYALRECCEDGSGRSRGPGHGPLTRRERQVASLLANGLTNREMASLLGTSERTVESHVQHILNKLAFGSRAQIAVWAVQQGLTGLTPGKTPLSDDRT